MDTSLPSAPIDSENTLLDHDLACVRCGYNLRTMATTGICPECSYPVASTLAESLYCADHRWLRRLRLGTVLMLVADLCLLGLFTAYLSVAVVPIGVFWLWLPIAIGVLGGACTVCWAFGVGLITLQQPRARGRTALRWTTRLTGLLALAVGLFLAITLVGIQFNVVMHEAVFVPMMVLASVLVFLAPMLVCLYCRPFGHRAQRPGLSRLNLALAVLFVIGLIPVASLNILNFGFDVQMSENPTFVFVGPFLLMLVCDFVGIYGLVAHWRLFSRIIRLRLSVEQA